MHSVAARFTEILQGLRAAIGLHVAKDRAREALFLLAWTRIGRMARRFESLFSKWQAGRLPKPRPSRAGRHAAASSPQPRKLRDPQPRIPRGRTWLVAQVGYHAAGRASQLQHLFTDPDFGTFIEAAPQVGRILRPLCHMLGIDPPPPLAPPVRPRRKPPARPAPRPTPRPTRLRRPRLPPVLFPARRPSTA